MRSSRSSSATFSGPVQLQLNALWQQQEWQVRMEQQQREFRDRHNSLPWSANAFGTSETKKRAAKSSG
ncbi:hypothetical protein PC121_g23048 [Phytophthora cactorum]|nr:hypothetical protein PC121_g23048 [Phytophthora cactorum]KAG4038768.1 hypothetical protein PC123_g25675 [Phytophthora cactorum]